MMSRRIPLPEGVVTIMFVDIVSSLAMMPVAGGVAALKAVEGLKKIIRRCVAAHEGSIVKSIGDDSYFLVFSDPEEAIQSAVDIQLTLAERPIETSIGSLRSSLQVRIGLHCGEVKVQKSIFGSEYIGPTVAKATYIEDLAEPGQVLVSQEIVDQVANHPRIKFQSKGGHVIEGVWRGAGVGSEMVRSRVQTETQSEGRVITHHAQACPGGD